MSKLKMGMLIIVAGVIVAFAYENRQPALVIKLFNFQLRELPQFLVIYISLAVGVLIGWVAHGLRIRRKRREAQAAQAALAQQQQKSQAGQDTGQPQ
jgi:uncharacterized integral membrane protein